MSPVPPETAEASTLDAIVRYAPVGFAASAIRALLSEQPTTLGWIARRTVAASITAWLVGPAIESVANNKDLAMLSVGAISYAAPEVWDWVGKKAIATFKALMKG